MATNCNLKWPDGKRFAFTIFDDTDLSTIENTKPVYDLFYDLGMRTTKSVWPLRGTEIPRVGGTTCEDPRYLEWILNLQNQGFEIGLHCATFHTSNREFTQRGLTKFRELFSHDPYSMANHTGCNDSIYWGSDRLSGANRFIYNVLTRFSRHRKYLGHVPGQNLFWGDLCKSQIKYVRNFVYSDINTLKMCPFMPYHDPNRPFVNHWFASSEGSEISAFNRCISEQRQDQLEAEGGACIMYSHLACGFFEDGHLDTRFEQLMRRLSKKNGWFVPVNVLLDHLLEKQGHHEITSIERRGLERRWLLDKLRTGPS